MAFFTTRTAAFLLSLSAALFAASATYTTAPIPTSDPNHQSPSISKPPESSISMDEKAQDVHYLRTHITAAATQVELFLATTVPGMLKGGATFRCQPQCLAVCPHLYRYSLDDLKKGLVNLEKGDFYMVNVGLTAFVTDIDTCDDCINESAKSDECLVEFYKFDAWAKQVGNELLARSIKY